jgi:hypothetical protein
MGQGVYPAGPDGEKGVKGVPQADAPGLHPQGEELGVLTGTFLLPQEGEEGFQLDLAEEAPVEPAAFQALGQDLVGGPQGLHPQDAHRLGPEGSGKPPVPEFAVVHLGKSLPLYRPVE